MDGDRWQAYDSELLSRSRRTRQQAEEPEAEAKPRQALVAQGVRVRAAPLPHPSFDELIRASRGGGVWRPVG